MKNSNEKLVHDFYQALEGYDFLTLKSLCSSDFVFYSQIDNPIHGVDGFIASETATLDGFRGFSMKPEVLISEADKVVAYVVFEGRDRLPSAGEAGDRQTAHRRQNPSPIHDWDTAPAAVADVSAQIYCGGGVSAAAIIPARGKAGKHACDYRASLPVSA